MSLDFWLLLLWFHMSTWLWPIAPTLQAMKSQNQHRAMAAFLRNNTSKARAHTQIWVPTRNFICYRWKMEKGNNSLQNCQKLSVWADTRQDPDAAESLPGRWLRSASLGWEETHRAHTWWWDCILWGTGEGQKCPENFQRRRTTSEGPARRRLWCLCTSTLPARHLCLRKKGQLVLSQLPHPLWCVFLKLFINLSAGPCFCS